MAYKGAKTACMPTLPHGLEELLSNYQEHCRKNGLCDSSIAQYGKECRWLLHNLAGCGCEEASQITASRVITAYVTSIYDYQAEQNGHFPKTSYHTLSQVITTDKEGAKCRATITILLLQS